MIYYSGLLIYIFILYAFTRRMRKWDRKIFFMLSCLGVILFQGFRSFTVGTDLASYIPSYSRIGASGFENLEYLNYEVGYVLLNKILFEIGLDERAFLIAIAVIIQIPIFYTMEKYSEHPMFSILWYFAFGNFIMTFSGLRQSIAMSLCFAAYYFIKEKKLIFYIMAIIFASLFHSSALFCLLLYPLYHMKLDKKKVVFALGIWAVIFLFRDRIFAFMSTLYYGKAIATTTTGAYAMFIAYVILFFLSFYKSPEDEEYIGLRNILFLLAIVYSFASMHDYVTRIGYPLSLYMTLFIPKVVNNYNVTPKAIYHGVCYIVLLAAFFYFLGGLNTLPFSFG